MKEIFLSKKFWLYFFSFFVIMNVLTIFSYKIFMFLNPYGFTLKNQISIELIFKKQLYHILNISRANWGLIFICCIRNFMAVLAFYSLVLGAKNIVLSNKMANKYYFIRNLILGFLAFFVFLGLKRGRAMTKIFFFTSNDNLIDNFSILFLTILWHETLEYTAIIVSSYVTIYTTLLKIKEILKKQKESDEDFIAFSNVILDNFKAVSIFCFILLFIASYIEIQLTPFAKFYDTTPPFFNK